MNYLFQIIFAQSSRIKRHTNGENETKLIFFFLKCVTALLFYQNATTAPQWPFLGPLPPYQAFTLHLKPRCSCFGLSYTGKKIVTIYLLHDSCDFIIPLSPQLQGKKAQPIRLLLTEVLLTVLDINFAPLMISSRAVHNTPCGFMNDLHRCNMT